MRLLLSDAQNLLSDYVEYGMCPTDPRVTREVNLAIERLMPILNPEKTIKRMQFDVVDQVITMPRQVKTVLGASTSYPSCTGSSSCGPGCTAILSVKSVWYEMLPGGPIGWVPCATNVLMDLGTGFSTFADPSTSQPMTLRLYADIPQVASEGFIVINGLDTNGNLPFSYVNNQYIPGQVLNIPTIPLTQVTQVVTFNGNTTSGSPTISPSALPVIINFNGVTTSGSVIVSPAPGQTLPSGLILGMTLSGPGIPSGATITSLASGVITMSLNATATSVATGVALTATGTSPGVLPSVLQVGMSLSGAGIPAGATINSLSGGNLTMSVNATATATSVAITATGTTPAPPANPYNDTPQMFTQINSITKPVTQGRLRLFGVDSTGAQFPLAVWEPDELNPDYRRYMVTWVGPSMPSILTVLVKLRYVYSSSPYADLLITNVGALRNALQAMKYERAGAFDQATAGWGIAKTILETETRDFDGEQGKTIQLQEWFSGGDIATIR